MVDSNLSKVVDRLLGKEITKLVLIYDRDYMPSYVPFPECWADLMLYTAEMPLYVFVYARRKLLAKYSSSPPHKSGRTWTIEVEAHSTMLVTILKKALTINGPKVYSFHGVNLCIPGPSIKLRYSRYTDIHISCKLSQEPPNLDGRRVKLGENGEYLFQSANQFDSKTKFSVGHLNFLKKGKTKLLMRRSTAILITL